MNLDKLLFPKTLAVVGASRKPGKVGYEVVSNLQKAGFDGTVVPINPTADEVLGFRCYPSFKDYGEPIDLAVICVPTKAVPEAVAEALKAKAGAVCVITAGFKEVDEEGAKTERELAELCHKWNARMLGPNCLGLINTHNGMNASFAGQTPREGVISVISQSGALCTAILDWAMSRQIGLSKLVSIGNKADLNESDFVSTLSQDDQTKVIVAYLESITSGDEFMRAAAAAAAKKPVIVLKVGTSSAGARAASSHTGSLAGADVAYGAAFHRSGIIRAATFEALFDYASALAMQPLPKGDRVAIITNAGGPGIMAADAVENSGMQVAELSGAIASALRSKLPAAASVGNPIDVLGDADPERYAEALDAAQGRRLGRRHYCHPYPASDDQARRDGPGPGEPHAGREARPRHLHGRARRHARSR